MWQAKGCTLVSPIPNDYIYLAFNKPDCTFPVISAHLGSLWTSPMVQRKNPRGACWWQRTIATSKSTGLCVSVHHILTQITNTVLWDFLATRLEVRKLISACSQNQSWLTGLITSPNPLTAMLARSPNNLCHTMRTHTSRMHKWQNSTSCISL